MTEMLQNILDLLYDAQMEEDWDLIDEAIEIIEKELNNPIKDYDKDDY